MIDGENIPELAELIPDDPSQETPPDGLGLRVLVCYMVFGTLVFGAIPGENEPQVVESPPVTTVAPVQTPEPTSGTVVINGNQVYVGP